MDRRESFVGILSRALDASIVWSFDRTGFERHARRFDRADVEVSMRGRVCLITGANRGLGLATAHQFAARGARVHLLCRDLARGELARDRLMSRTGHPDIYAHEVDMASVTSIERFVARLEEPRVDVMVHNAGLLPPTRSLSPDGLEMTVAVHVVGPHVLTAGLRPRLVDARVIFVSSGGMYTKRLDVGAMLDTTGRYDGVAAYAMTKRAQVVLTEQWAQRLSDRGTVVHAMHPGWAATPGVQVALPRFWQAMEARLRSPEQGADTVVWLALADAAERSTGGFWFDRAPAVTHRVPWTRENDEQRRRLWALVQRYVRRVGVGDEREIDR